MTEVAQDAGRTVTGRVFAILDAFAPGEARLTLTQISRLSGLPIATTHRLTAELVRLGGLEREPGGTYRIGTRMWEIGSLAPVRGGLRELAIQYMEDLYEATHANVQLAVLRGLDALFLEKISGRESIRIVTRVGGRLPLHATGVGKVLLAYAAARRLRRDRCPRPRSDHAQHDRRPRGCVAAWTASAAMATRGPWRR